MYKPALIYTSLLMLCKDFRKKQLKLKAKLHLDLARRHNLDTLFLFLSCGNLTGESLIYHAFTIRAHVQAKEPSKSVSSVIALHRTKGHFSGRYYPNGFSNYAKSSAERCKYDYMTPHIASRTPTIITGRGGL